MCVCVWLCVCVFGCGCVCVCVCVCVYLCISVSVCVSKCGSASLCFLLLLFWVCGFFVFFFLALGNITRNSGLPPLRAVMHDHSSVRCATFMR